MRLPFISGNEIFVSPSVHEYVKTFTKQCVFHYNLAPCAFASCEYNKKCSVNVDRTVRCSCLTSCPNINEPVCGTDGNTYPSQCHLEKKSCETKTFLQVEKIGKCGKVFQFMTILKKCPMHVCVTFLKVWLSFSLYPCELKSKFSD